MTVALQLLAFIAAIVGLILFGVYRDRKEHKDARQSEIYFPERDDNEKHQGAAMSRIG
jgi:hypothetical protein